MINIDKMIYNNDTDGLSKYLSTINKALLKAKSWKNMSRLRQLKKEVLAKIELKVEESNAR